MKKFQPLVLKKQLLQQRRQLSLRKFLKILHEEPEIVIPEVVMQITDTPLPKPKDPFSRKQKFKDEDFFGEHVFFTDYNPYDSARIRKRRFWTASQANFYSSVLFNKDKVFDHAHIPHVDMESLPCFTPVLS